MNQSYTLYFDSKVSDHLNVPFSNKDHKTILPATEILNCPVASWDQETINILKRFKNEEIALQGEGVGEWKVL
jgi:hypothetical protein